MAWMLYLLGAATTAALMIVPVGELAIWLWLISAAEFGLGLLVSGEMPRRPRVANRIVAVNDDEPSGEARRIVPHLRANRPPDIVEAQLRWRRAAEARRRRLRKVS